MSASSAPDADAPPADVLMALDSDTWAQFVRVARAALHDLDDSDVTPVVERLRAAPASRLAGGRVRRELCELLAHGGAAWLAVRNRIDGLEPLPDGLSWLAGRDGLPPDPGPARSDTAGDSAAAGRHAGDTRRRRELDRARDRLREARADRDAWRRRAEGAEARAEASAGEVAAMRVRLEANGMELEAVREELAAQGEERARALKRERRRRDAEVAALSDELSAMRRADQQRRAEARRRVEARELVERDAAREVEQARRSLRGDTTPTAVPGRPSQLPSGVAPGTTQAAKALLHAGRLVLVDGYNVTKQHRGRLDLESQRSWLVGVLATLVARRRIRAVVVFDGERAGGGRPPAGVRDVTIRFTGVGVTADDELVLAVEGTDDPVVVVTDDRELTARVTASGADVVGTRAFLGVAS